LQRTGKCPSLYIIIIIIIIIIKELKELRLAKSAPRFAAEPGAPLDRARYGTLLQSRFCGVIVGVLDVDFDAVVSADPVLSPSPQ
jgi:hypothetical protein